MLKRPFRILVWTISPTFPAQRIPSTHTDFVNYEWGEAQLFSTSIYRFHFLGTIECTFCLLLSFVCYSRPFCIHPDLFRHRRCCRSPPHHSLPSSLYSRGHNGQPTILAHRGSRLQDDLRICHARQPRSLSSRTTLLFLKMKVQLKFSLW